MDAHYQKITRQIEGLRQQQQRIEESWAKGITNLVMETTRHKIDLATLAGLVLNAPQLATGLPHKTEGWQSAGRKFLSGTRNTRPQPEAAAPHPADQPPAPAQGGPLA